MNDAPPAAARIGVHTARWIGRASRRAHRFHRFAHHPLCDRYAPEVLHAFGLVLCRGCVAGGAGIAAGLVAGWLLAPAWPLAATAAAVGAASLALGRRTKTFHRFLPAAGLHVAIGAALSRGNLPSTVVGAAALAFGLVGWLLWRRRGPDRSPCAACPERTRPICSGLAPIVEAEQRFRAAAARRLDAERAETRRRT